MLCGDAQGQPPPPRRGPRRLFGLRQGRLEPAVEPWYASREGERPGCLRTITLPAPTPHLSLPVVPYGVPLVFSLGAQRHPLPFSVQTGLCSGKRANLMAVCVTERVRLCWVCRQG